MKTEKFLVPVKIIETLSKEKKSTNVIELPKTEQKRSRGRKRRKKEGAQELRSYSLDQQ